MWEQYISRLELTVQSFVFATYELNPYYDYPTPGKMKYNLKFILFATYLSTLSFRFLAFVQCYEKNNEMKKLTCFNLPNYANYYFVYL